MQHHQTWTAGLTAALTLALGIAAATVGGCAAADTKGKTEPGKVATATGTKALTSMPAPTAGIPADYKGKPWKGEMQIVPGKVYAPLYDVGGEGVASHDETPKNNHGSGELNRGPEAKDNFRKDEGVDISYTKPAFDRFTDGAVLPPDQYYVGWTAGGEWIKCTVDVKAAGAYTINLLASSNNKDAQIGFDVNGVPATAPITLASTGNWHTWTMYNNIATIKLAKGPQVITLKFIKEGNMNVQYFELIPAIGAPK
jgi:hypothetical protein